MMQAPDIGQMIMHHTSDAHEIALEWPWGGETVIHLPQLAPLHIGGLTIDVSPTKHVVFMLLAATLVWLTMFVAGRVLTRQRAEGKPPRGLASMVEAMVLFVRWSCIISVISYKQWAHVSTISLPKVSRPSTVRGFKHRVRHQ